MNTTLLYKYKVRCDKTATLIPIFSDSPRGICRGCGGRITDDDGKPIRNWWHGDCKLDHQKKDFIIRSNAIHGTQYSYDHVIYKSQAQTVDILCSAHGKYKQKPVDHLRGSGCPECARQDRAMLMRTPRQKWIDKADVIFGKLYDYSLLPETFTGNHRIPIRCHLHEVFYRRATHHLNYKLGCPICAKTKMYNKKTLGEKEIRSRIDRVFGDSIQLIEVGKSTSDTVKYRCLHHGIQVSIVSSLLRGSGCVYCKKHGSTKESLWLDKQGVLPENRQMVIKVNDGIGKEFLRVDGYLPSTKTVFEFNGDFWHGNPTLYRPSEKNRKNGKLMGDLYEETIIKKRRLEQAGYNVVSIWESEWEKR